MAWLFLAGCGHSKKSVRDLAPAAAERVSGAATSPTPQQQADPKGKAIYTEIGMASWYGPPYHNRRGSNGEVFDMNALTAAHRTLPLNSVARVTNVQTGHTTRYGSPIEDPLSKDACWICH